MGLQEAVAHLASGVSPTEQIAKRERGSGRARHLLAGAEHQPRVEPVARHRPARQGLADGVLVLVVREGQVLPAGVDVERQAEVLRGHGGTLDVPAGPNVSPIGLVGDPPAQLLEIRAPHQREVARVVLLVVVEIDGGARLDLGRIDAAELAVALELADVEVDGALHLVRHPRLDQLAGQLHHLVDVLGGARVVVGRKHAQHGHVVEELGGVLPGELLQPDAAAPGLGDRLVVDVREVDDVTHLVAVVLQHLLEDVDGEQAPYQADVHEVVQRRAAGVDADPPFVVRPEDRLAARQRVVELDHRLMP